MFLDEILLIIFSFLSFQDKKLAWLVSRQFRRVILTILAPNYLFIEAISCGLNEMIIIKYSYSIDQLFETIIWYCLEYDTPMIDKFISSKDFNHYCRISLEKAFRLMIAIGNIKMANHIGEKIVHKKFMNERKIFYNCTFENILILKNNYKCYIGEIYRIFRNYSEFNMMNMEEFLNQK
jgi:hypothetical protein